MPSTKSILTVNNTANFQSLLIVTKTQQNTALPMLNKFFIIIIINNKTKYSAYLLQVIAYSTSSVNAVSCAVPLLEFP